MIPLVVYYGLFHWNFFVDAPEANGPVTTWRSHHPLFVGIDSKLYADVVHIKIRCCICNDHRFSETSLAAHLQKKKAFREKNYITTTVGKKCINISSLITFILYFLDSDKLLTFNIVHT